MWAAPGEGEEKDLTTWLAGETGKVAEAALSGDFEAFSARSLVDRKRYEHYYQERHGIEIAERGWVEFVDGIKATFQKKHEALGKAKPLNVKNTCAKDGEFTSCEVWADFEGKKKEETVQIILHFTRIKGRWKVMSLE